MNCTLTPDQQKQLFKKVYSDLKTKESPLDFKEYAEEVYDLINNKLKDSAMALSYVSLLPQNIRLNIGVNKSLSQKFAKNFEEITQLEDSFTNLDNVSEYVKNLKKINVGDIVSLEKDIQDNSLRADNNPEKIEIVEKVIENPIEPVTGLSDLTFENVSPGEEILSPDKKLYANVKRQLIKNAKQDGSSYIEGFGLVKLQVVSTQLLEDKDLYPDTQRQIQNGDDATKAKIKKSNQTGAVLIVTDSDNKILYFDENGTKVDRATGKPAYFLFRNPQPNKEGNFTLSDLDKQAIMQMAKALKLSHEDATKAYLNRIGVYKNIRKFINEAPLQNKLEVNIAGGFIGVPSKADSALKTPLAGLNLGKVSFFPYQGVEAKGQNLQSYYFDIPNLPVPVQIKRPDISKEMAEKLASLIFDDLHIEQRGAKYPLAPQEKIRLFEQFFYTSPITISFKVGDDGKIIMRKFGDVVTAKTPQEYKDILIDYLTRLQPSKELKKEQVGTRKIVTDIADAKNNYVYKVEDNGKTRYFLVQPSQLEISRTAMKNNSYEDFTLENVEGALIYKSEQKPYTDFIKNNFVINYPLDASGNIQTVNAVLNFDLPVDSVSKIKNKKAIDKKIEDVEKTSISLNINDTQLGGNLDILNKSGNLVTEKTKHELQDIIEGKSPSRSGRLIQTITRYLRASSPTGEATKRVGTKEREESLLKKYASDNNLLVKNIPFDKEIGGGEEHVVYLDKDGKHVIKLNNLKRYKSWEAYLNNLLLHNYFFPETAYELIGFTEKDSKLFPVVKQNFVETSGSINLTTLTNLLAHEGFVKSDPDASNYYHRQLGIELEDLHPQNVIQGPRAIYVIDSIFNIKPTFYDLGFTVLDKKNILKGKLSPKEFLEQQRRNNPDAFNKLIDQKGLQATEDQIADAMNWYNSHPMSKAFPFESVFNVINLNNPNSIATWTANGITLFKGSDFSDLYHEAWHGFSQGFLSKNDKTSLYNELRKKSGSFTDYTGTRVTFAKATELQAEEFLAEDFREFMLSGGKKVMKDSPIRRNIFTKIFDFLKSLFGGTTYNQALIDRQVNNTVKTLYDKLRLGNLTDFSFSVENRNFNTLNKGIQAMNTMDVPSLSFEDSKLMLDTVNSLFSEYADANNSYTETSDEAKEGPKQTYKYTTRLFETPEGLKATYEYVRFRLISMFEEFESQQETNPSQELQNKIDLLKWAGRNFGNVKDLLKNKSDAGVIGYHLTNSDYIPTSIKEDLQEDADWEGRETEGKQYYDRGGNETSIFDLANKEIINILKGLPKYDSKGIVYSKLGLPELNPFNETFAHIAKTVQNLTTPQKMYEAMEKETENYPTLKHLLEKLGPVEYEGQSTDEVNNWTRFWQTFNKYRIPLIQTTLNNVVVTDREGRKVSSTYEIAIGNAVADFRRVGQKWENLFAQAQTNPFIKNNTTGNYLDIDAILKKYPNKSDVNGNEFDFLTDIGIALKDTRTIKGELNKSIRSGDIKLGGIYDNIKKLSEKGILVKSISRYIKKDTDLGIEGEGGANGNYGKLEKLQYRFADEDADFMVINAAGDPQSEFSQNTTLTQLIKRINEVDSYSELISSPEMGYLNKTELEPGKSYNPAIESSIWIKSLFNMNAPGGPKYPGAKIDIVNLSGLTKSVNGNNTGEGDISTDLDEYSKLIQDIHTQLMSGTPELTRHAGKKTSLSVFLNNYKTYAGKTTTNLYIDTDDFAVQSGNISKGVAQGIELITPYITSELKRINYAKYLMSDEANVKNYDFVALKKMTEFAKFSGVLSEGTQKKLLAIKGDVDAYLKSAESLSLRNEIENDVIKYFGDLYKGIDKKLSEAEYLSPSLYKGIKSRLTANGNLQFANDATVRTAIINSFIWNNWIHHVEENIVLYGDVSLYKNEQDFFKRNAALNSTGDILRNDAAFKRHVNTNLGKPLAAKLGATPDALTYNGILNTAVVSDIEIPSVYHAQYKEALDEAIIDKAYGKVNEADAAAFVSYDTYRIIRSALGKWGKEDEALYQKELNGESIKNIEKFPAVVKMGYYGPLETNYLPLQALHKFALFPLIPSVVKGTNLENLHNKMMKEGIDYLTFKSGSKISTITHGEDNPDKLYSNTTKRVISGTPFTKNPIYVDYLKDQVEASSKFKNKVTFFSQLRKLVDNGLMENGVPVDFKGGKENWAKLSLSEKLIASPKKFKKRYDFLSNLNKLQDYKRQQLLGELGWKLDKNGKPTGDIKPLLELITRELKRRDFPEHTWQFIQTIKDNQIKNSLDTSQFAEDIEKVVVAVINKRLVNFKVNGEQLVQVTGTGFENVSFAYGEGRNFEKPTAEDLKKYGTNDLPTYHKNADGTTAAAKVKIALQGQFKNLLKLTEVQAKAKDLKVDPRTALNTLLKDEEWLNTGDNRRMVTMIGARIPTQGLNSMEFVEVYEFLPEEAGSIIIAPSEITAKSGTDYDYDKLPMMMPNIRVKAGKVELAVEYSKKQAKELYDTLINFNVNKASLQGVTRKDLQSFMNEERFDKFETEMIKLWGENYLDNLVDVVKNDSGLSDFDTFFERLNGTAVIENNIIQSIKNILSDPDNFTSLIRPNSTEKVEPIAKDIMAPLVTDPSLLRTDSRGTAIFEPLKNLQIHQSNTTGKRTLGIGAIENTYNTIFNGIGMYLNPTFTKGNNKTPFRADILLSHNSVTVEGQPVISLGGLKDAATENNTADIISQLINGWVDVEKDDWVSYIQGNQEVAPMLLFLVQAGVPIKDAIYFVSQPLIRQYVKEQRLYKSKFADVLGKISDNPRATRIAARNSILGNVQYNFQIGDKLSDKNIYDATLNETKGITNFTQDQLLENLKHYSASTNRGQQFKPGDLDRQTFLHYLELENMVGYMQQLKAATNVDTTTATTLFDMRAKVGEIEKNESGNLFPAKMVEAIKTDSAIGPYFMQEFASDIFGRLFPLRNNEIVNQYISNLGFNKDLATIFGEKEKMVKLFKNDLIGYIFQNGVRKFTLEGLQHYKNNELTITTAETEFGAVVKGDKLFVDKEALKHVYDFQVYTRDDYGLGLLAKLNQNTFTSFDEYSHFVLERETLRSMYNLSSLKNDFEFKGLVKKYLRKDDLRKEGQTNEEFAEMVDKKSYEEWLRNKALYNILNPWIMFKSGQSVADKFARIIEQYPQVKDDYSFLKGIQYSEGQQGYRNLKLAGAKIDGPTAEIYNENLKNLKNESIIKVDNVEDNKYISDFFSDFSTYMFMQSGLNNTPFAFNKVILQEDISRLLDGPYKEALNEMSPAYLDKFSKLFLMQNANKAVRLRSKNYLEGGFDYGLSAEEIKDVAAEEVEAPKPIISQKIVISPEELTDLLSQCYK